MTKNDLKLQKGTEKEMSDNLSFTSRAFFCLVWEYNGQNSSVWSKNLDAILKIFFKLKIKSSVYYFPGNGSNYLEIFRRDDEIRKQA